MGVATVRERLESPGFVPRHPLPEEPHKNLKLREALKLAGEWGCTLKVISNNDVLVGHPLFPHTGGGIARSTIPVSSTREDTSQGLVSFLRRVREAVLEHPIYLASIPARPPKEEPVSRLHIPPLKAEPVRELAPTKVEPPDNGKIMTLPELREGMNTSDLPDVARIRQGLDDACKTLGSIVAAVHYSHHMTLGGTYVAFSDCKNEMCMNARKALADVSGTARTVSDLGHSNRILREENTKLLDDLTKPVTMQAAAPMAPLKLPPRRPFTAALVEPLIREGDTQMAKQEKVDSMLVQFMNRIYQFMHARPSVHTRVGKALKMLAGKITPEQMEWCLVSGDFTGWKLQICQLKEPGAGQVLVGFSRAAGHNSGWDMFETACTQARAKYPLRDNG